MQEKLDLEGILTGTDRLGPYPMEKLKRINHPTTRLTNNIQRFDSRDAGFSQVRRGYFGEAMKNAWMRNHPIATSEKLMTVKFKDMVEGEVAASKPSLSQDPKILSRHIKSLGYFWGADIVGICELPQWAVYSHDYDGNPVELNHKFAISIIADQDYKTMSGSTGHDWISRSQSSRAYAVSGMIGGMMADYIRHLGFPARAHVFRNELIIKPPLLLLAGIGEVSRPGIILNPFLGLRYKAAVVTTDFPLMADSPIDFGLQEFCRQCVKCAVECPSQAISHGDKVIHNGYEVWKLDYERCLKHRVLNPIGSSCGRCIKVCPWNKPRGWILDVVRWMVRNAPWSDNLLVKIDDILGYGKQHMENKWWFDFIEIIKGEGRQGPRDKIS
jgi:reductive dehalogenase